jgi:NADPH:quinone reductase-like Zn-dependent oxidoreductase
MSISRFGGPEVLEPATIELPVPGPQQVRVRVHFAAVNPMDAKIRSGAAFFPVSLPAVLGREFSGVVDAVGGDVVDLTPGDRVAGVPDLGYGCYAEYTLATVVTRIPDGVGLAAGAAVPIAAGTASRVLEELSVSAGDVVLVNGASGAVGALAVQLAIGRGATVVGTASPARQAEVAALGAIPTTYGEGLVSRVRALAPRIDAAFDAAGQGSLPDLIELRGGTSRLVTIADDQAAALGVRFSSGGGFGHDAEHIAEALRLIANGLLRVTVGRTYPLADAARAHADLGNGARGKLLLQP